MKRLIIFLVLFNISLKAQIVVGGYNAFSHDPKENKLDFINLLKSKKTIFVLPPNFSKDEYIKVISEVWDITPFEVTWHQTHEKELKQEMFDKFNRDNHSFFYLTSLTIHTKYDFLFNTLDLKVYGNKRTDKKGKEVFNEHRIATIFFTPSIGQRANSSAKTVDAIDFINYDLGHLKTYLRFINNKLKNNEYVNCYDESFKKEDFIKLKSKKLIIPESVKLRYSSTSRTKGEIIDENELLKDYKYSYEFVSDENLNQMLLNDEDIYFLDYGQVNADKFISIISSKTGEIVYSEFTSLSYNIKSSDFKSISKLIEKVTSKE